MKKTMAMLLAALFISCTAIECEAAEKSWTFMEDTYVVQKGDTLNSVAEEYMKKNTYGAREIREFTAGIKQLNEWLLTRELTPGDELRINYWTK